MDINIVSVMLYSAALVPIALSIAFALLLLKTFTGKSLRSSKYPPICGTVFSQLVYFNQLYDYMTGLMRRSPTIRLLAPDQSEIYTADPRNVEHILKTNFDQYTKGKYNIDIMGDLFGEGIFMVDGEKWKKQRKVASFEFATRVLRDFSCCVFRKNAAKLVKVVEESSAASEGFDMQVSSFNFSIVRTPRGSTPPDSFVERITDPVLDRMHYLHATLTETLRLYPAVPSDGRCAETDDVLPDGFHVKKGDCVYYLAYSMGRMHNIWGEDAEDFKPERWLKDGIFQNESPFKFVAFNAGPRICLGKDFAYRQMKIVSIALLRFFCFRLADETRSVTYKVMFTLHINNGLHLRAVPRSAT